MPNIVLSCPVLFYLSFGVGCFDFPYASVFVVCCLYVLIHAIDHSSLFLYYIYVKI